MRIEASGIRRYRRAFAVAAVLLAAACAADAGDDEPLGPGTGEESFRVLLTPASLDVEQGAIDTITVRLDRTGGYAGEVTLAPDSLPSGVSLPTTVVPAGADSVRVAVSVSAHAAAGAASFVLHAIAPGRPVLRTTVPIRIVAVVGSIELRVVGFPLAYDDTTDVQAIVRALDGSQVLDARVTWTTGDTSVIHLLDDEGTTVRVHGWGEGIGSLFALSDSVWGSASVFVDPAPVDRIDVLAPKDTLTIGETMQAGSLGWDSHGHSLNRVSWWSSSDENVITLGELGEVRAVGPGVANIRVVMDGHGTVGTRPIVVIGGRPATVRVFPDAIRLQSGQRQIFTAVVYDERGLALDDQPAVQWSIDDETVAIFPSTPYTGAAEAMAIAEGTTNVRAHLMADPAISGSALIVVDDPTSLWEGDIGSITVQPRVFGYDYDTETSVTCVYDVVYTGRAVAQTVLSDQYVDIDIAGEYHATLVSGTGNCLQYDETGTFTDSYLAPHDGQPFTSSEGWIMGPNLTTVTMQMAGTVPVDGSFDLQLTITPYDERGYQGQTPLTPVIVSVPMTAQN